VTLATATARSSLYSFTAFIWSAVVLVAITPLLIRHLGAEGYGIYALTIATVGFVGLLEFGMGTSLVQLLATRFARNEDEEARATIGASIVFYMVVGVAGTSIAVSIGLLFTSRLFSLSNEATADARFAFVVAGLAFFFSSLTKSFSSIQLALQRYDVVAKVRILFATATGLGVVALLFAGFGLRAIVLLNALAEPLSLLTYFVLGRRSVRGLTMWPLWDTPRLRRLLTFSGWVFVSSTSGLFLFQLDRIFLGTLASVELVTYYAVPGSVASYIYAATVTVSSVAIPVSASLASQQKTDQLAQLYIRATRLVAVFILSISIPAFVFAHEILLEWIGPEMAERSGDVFRVLILTYVALALTVVPFNVLVGAGRPRIPAIINLVMAVLNVALVFVLIPRYELMGAAVAYLGSVVIFPAATLYIERRFLRLSRSPWRALLPRLVAPAAVQAGVCLAVLPLIDNLATLVAALVVSPAVFGLTYVVLGGADSNDAALVRSLLGSVRSAFGRYAA
jgi:O-antigen/teichoic acid export membrane protein